MKPAGRYTKKLASYRMASFESRLNVILFFDVIPRQINARSFSNIMSKVSKSEFVEVKRANGGSQTFAKG